MHHRYDLGYEGTAREADEQEPTYTTPLGRADVARCLDEAAYVRRNDHARRRDLGRYWVDAARSWRKFAKALP